MARALKLTHREWKDVKKQIALRHPKSVLLLRSKMREVLGFTPREHTEWSEERGSTLSIHLDFFDESQRTMFLLKYGDWIGQKHESR